MSISENLVISIFENKQVVFLHDTVNAVDFNTYAR